MESLVMLTGSCLCGSVAYEVDAPTGPIVHCHCTTCRKTHGAAFSTVMPVPRAAFRWLRGEELLSSFESSPGKRRRFCTRCGSHIVADRPKLHMWRSEAASWYNPRDVLPEFPEAPS